MPRRSGAWLAAVLLLVLLQAAAPLQAQTDTGSLPFQDELASLSGQLDSIRADLADRASDGDPSVERRLQSIMKRGDRLSDEAQLRVARLQEQLTALGEPPPAGMPPEPAPIAAERVRTQAALAELETESRVAAFVRVRAHQLLETVAARQRAAVLDVIMLETPPPWNPAVWRDGAAEFAQVLAWLRFKLRAWFDWFRLQGGTLALLQTIAAAAAAMGMALAGTGLLGRRLAAGGDERRVAAQGGLAAIASASIPCAGLLAVLVLWSAQGWLTGQFGAVLQRLLIATMAALLGGAMLRSWAGSRAGPMRPETVRALIWSCVALMVLAVGVSLVKEAALRQPVPPPALLAVLATMTGATAFLLLAPWLRHSAWPSDGPTAGPPRMLVRGVLAFVAVVPLGTALLGRAVLATYLFNRALAVLVLIWTVAQLRKVAHESLRSALDRPPQALADAPPAEEEVPDAPARIASYWAALAVDIVLALVTLRLLLQLLDIPQVQIDYWTGLAFGDIQVGGAVISLPDILLAMLVLAGGLFASSRLRRWLGKSVLPRSGMEIGLRTSIAAGAGYLGMVLAILAAIATAGISLSSVAIVAGALSVGMGFGLRTVVENFVAGLLMLIERPVRVGDWVVIGDTEGTVRRISVRATEIETFDSASVVVPNSLFVSSPVTNWTLQNRRGRIHVKVGVGYEADPAKVQALLLECARTNRAVASYPAPQALFIDFGDSALLFELRCHVRDVDNYATARSDLLVAIETSLRANDIEVPYPQQVVHRGKGWEEASAEVVPPPVPIRSAS